LIYSTKDIQYPTNEEELRKIILNMKNGKVLGTKHSFNLLADTEGTLISSSKMDRILKLDRENRIVWVESGIKYGDLGKYLHQNGFSLENLASLPHISVGGAIQSATHG
jgi:alditol oxidase